MNAFWNKQYHNADYQHIKACCVQESANHISMDCNRDMYFTAVD